jgi:hypothetical protein
MALYIATHKAPDPRFEASYTYILSSANLPELAKMGTYLTDRDPKNHIAHKNGSYSELTCLYALYQLLEEGRLNDSYIGLYHYRRYLTEYESYSTVIKRINRKLRHRFKTQPYFILNDNRARMLLSTEDTIIVPKPNHFNCTVYEHYRLCHHIQDLDIALQIIRDADPSYETAITLLCNQTYLHSYNMFIMHKSLFFEYTRWLFALLERIESQISTEGRNTYQKRVSAFLAERLFNLWLIRQATRIKLIEKEVLLFEGAS